MLKFRVTLSLQIAIMSEKCGGQGLHDPHGEPAYANDRDFEYTYIEVFFVEFCM